MKNSKFIITIDILGVVAFWIIAIGTIWQVYYTRLVYVQNNQYMATQSAIVIPPNVDNPSTIPNNNGSNNGGTYTIPAPPDYLNPYTNPFDNSGPDDYYVPLNQDASHQEYDL